MTDQPQSARFGDITVTRTPDGSVLMDRRHIPGVRKAQQTRFWDVNQAQAALTNTLMRGGGQADLVAALRWVVGALG